MFGPELETPSDPGWFCPRSFDGDKGRFLGTGKIVEDGTKYCVGRGGSTSRDFFFLFNLIMLRNEKRMSAPKQRMPIERPTASGMVDVLLADGTEVEVGIVVLVGETLDVYVVKVEEGSAEASSLRRTLIQRKERWGLD